MAYQGVKFKTEMIGKDVPMDTRINELKDWCNKFHICNLAPPYEGGSCGNLSFRLRDNQDSFIITGSRIGLKNKLSDDCFVEVSSVNLEKGIVYAKGIREPSSESMLHFAIYKQRQDINAIFHGHSPKILACVNKLNIQETKKEEPYGTMELVRSVLAILDNQSFLVMKNHGFIALGKTMGEAGELVLQINKKCF